LHTVGNYLRTLDVKDGELICWHDSTHPLYIDLDIQPGIRFIHVITNLRVKNNIPAIRAEVFRSPAKYIVSDLVAVAHMQPIDTNYSAGPTNTLPDDLPNALHDCYPWNQPVIYRVGRYLVHRVDTPRGEIGFPLPGAPKE
jgi:hypothetical protein